MKRVALPFKLSLLTTITISLLALVLALPFSRPQPALAQTASSITMNVVAGYDGFFRANQWTPLFIEVSNTGAEINGELRVTANSSQGLAANAYATDITLATQSSKQIPLNVKLYEYASSVQIELVTENGIIATQSRPLKVVSAGNMLFAVVTESPRGTVDVQTPGNTIAQGAIVQANWRLENIPRSAQGLSGLDGLVLTDVDTGNLAAEQRLAIREWVLSGGHLVVTGGPNWQKTQAGISDLLPVTPSNTSTLTSVTSLATYAGLPDVQLSADSPITVTQLKLKPDALILAQESGLPLLARQRQGEGVVDYMAIDPGLEPLSSWTERSLFWSALLTLNTVRPSWSYGVTNTDQASLSADFIKGLRLPDVLQLVGFLGAYILLIGPANYLILRWLKRPELAWVTIPLVVIATSVYAYTTGFSLRGTLATVNRLAVVQAWVGSDRAEVDGVLGILAPRRGNYDISVRNNMSLQSLTNTDSAVNPALGSNLTIYEGTDYQARNIPVDAGTTAAFLVEGFTQITPLEGTATMEIGRSSRTGVSSAPTLLKGTIKNTTGMTLTDVVVLGMGNTYNLGTLDAGEEAEFTMTVNGGVASKAAPGSVFPPAGYYGGFGSVGIGYTDPSLQEQTIHDILGSGYYSPNGRSLNSSLEDQENWRRQSFLRAIALDYNPSGGRGTDVFVAGWTATSPMEVDLPSINFVTEDSTLWLFRLPIQIKAAEADGLVEIPSAFMTWAISPDSRLQDAGPFQLALRYGENAIFRFNMLSEVNNLDIDELRIRAVMNDNASILSGQISLWNWTTGVWDVVTIRNGTQFANIVDPAPYLGVGNTVQMKVEPSSSGQGYVFYDRIELTMYGKLK
ncbi:MAG: hypothetical protein U0528_05695 [Anaerolineae bacterium]|nr:hypothetical protein [Anaerolineae bacterium]